MEILHVFGIHWKLLLAQVVNFSIALFVLYRFVYRPIFKILAEREALIHKGLDDAKHAEEDRKAAETGREEILLSAREDGGRLADALHKKGVEEERRIVREAQDKSMAILAEAQARAKEEHAYMMKKSEAEMAKMAVLAAEKILRADLAKN